MADRYDLKRLRRVASEACEKASRQHDNFGNDPINWADFDCRAAYFQVDDEGDESYMITLEGASPDCRHIKEFVSRELEAAGFLGVEVQTEW